MDKGKIIFLNGLSCTGKTTLAQKLQERLSEPFYAFSSDTFIRLFTPKKFLGPETDTAYKSMLMLPYTIKSYSNKGLHTIVDTVFTIHEFMQECVDVLHDYPVLFVHVTCELEEHRRRAKERGDSFEWVEKQSSKFMPKEPYDLIIDTSKDDCIDKIIELLHYPDKFTAFKTLWSQRTIKH